MAEDFEKILARISKPPVGAQPVGAPAAPKPDDDFEGLLSKISNPQPAQPSTPKTYAPGLQFDLRRDGRERFIPEGADKWNLKTGSDSIKNWYQTTYRRPLPIKNFGQSDFETRVGWNHENAMDVGLNPTTPEGQAFIQYLRQNNIPYQAFSRPMTSKSGRTVATGPHIHVGLPSQSLGRAPVSASAYQTPQTVASQPAQPNVSRQTVSAPVAPVFAGQISGRANNLNTQPPAPPPPSAALPSPIQNPDGTVTETFVPGEKYAGETGFQVPQRRPRRQGEQVSRQTAQPEPVTATYTPSGDFEVRDLSPEEQATAQTGRDRVTPETIQRMQAEYQRQAEKRAKAQPVRINSNDLLWHLGITPGEFKTYSPRRQSQIASLVAQQVQRDAQLRAQGKEIPRPTVEQQNTLRGRLRLGDRTPDFQGFMRAVQGEEPKPETFTFAPQMNLRAGKPRFTSEASVSYGSTPNPQSVSNWQSVFSSVPVPDSIKDAGAYIATMPADNWRKVVHGINNPSDWNLPLALLQRERPELYNRLFGATEPGKAAERFLSNMVNAPRAAAKGQAANDPFLVRATGWTAKEAAQFGDFIAKTMLLGGGTAGMAGASSADASEYGIGESALAGAKGVVYGKVGEKFSRFSRPIRAAALGASGAAIEGGDVYRRTGDPEQALVAGLEAGAKFAPLGLLGGKGQYTGRDVVGYMRGRVPAQDVNPNLPGEGTVYRAQRGTAEEAQAREGGLSPFNAPIERSVEAPKPGDAVRWKQGNATIYGRVSDAPAPKFAPKGAVMVELADGHLQAVKAANLRTVDVQAPSRSLPRAVEAENQQAKLDQRAGIEEQILQAKQAVREATKSGNGAEIVKAKDELTNLQRRQKELAKRQPAEQPALLFESSEPRYVAQSPTRRAVEERVNPNIRMPGTSRIAAPVEPSPTPAVDKRTALDALRQAPDRATFYKSVEEAKRAGATQEEIDAALRPESSQSIPTRREARNEQVIPKNDTSVEGVARERLAPSQPTPAIREQGSKPDARLTRNYRAGMNNASVTFASPEQRDLYDIAANARYLARGGQNKTSNRPVKDTSALQSSVAQRLGIPESEVMKRAFEVHDDVRAQMKGVKDGKTRAVVDNMIQGQKEATPPAAQSNAVAPKIPNTEASLPVVPPKPENANSLLAQKWEDFDYAVNGKLPKSQKAYNEVASVLEEEGVSKRAIEQHRLALIEYGKQLEAVKLTNEPLPRIPSLVDSKAEELAQSHDWREGLIDRYYKAAEEYASAHESIVRSQRYYEQTAAQVQKDVQSNAQVSDVEPPHHSNFQPRRVRGGSRGQFKKGKPEREPYQMSADELESVGLSRQEASQLGAAKDIGRVAREVRLEQEGFFKAKGLSPEQVRALTPDERARLQNEYQLWRGQPKGSVVETPTEEKPEVGPHGRFSSLLRRSFTHPAGEQLPAFLTEPSVRKAVGLPEVSSDAAKSSTEMQATADAIAKRMRAARSSYLGPNGFQRFIELNREKLSDDAIDSYHATVLEHEQYNRKQDAFLNDPEVVSLLSRVEETGNVERGAIAKLNTLAKKAGISQASARAYLETARGKAGRGSIQERGLQSGDRSEAAGAQRSDQSERQADSRQSTSNQEPSGQLEEDGPLRSAARLQTKTEAFKNWFGDSKVVDERGEPLVVYHGTNADFEGFNAEAPARNPYYADDNGLGFFFDKSAGSQPDMGRWHGAAGFAGTRQVEGEITAPTGANIVPAYLSVKQPKTYDYIEYYDAIEKAGGGKELQGQLKRQGYDGVIRLGTSGEPLHFIAFSPTQIKSATGNQGTFNAEDPNILRKQEEFNQRVQALTSSTPQGVIRGMEWETNGNQISLNPESYIVARGALDAVQMQRTGKPFSGFQGAFLTPKQVENLIPALKTFAKAYGRQGAKAFELAREIERASKAKGTAILLTNSGARLHELHHEGSYLAARLGGDVTLRGRHADFDGLISDPVYKKAEKALRPDYPDNSDGEMVDEIASHLVEAFESGDYSAVNLSADEAVSWYARWYRSLKRRNGIETRKQFEELANESAKIREAVESAEQLQPSREDVRDTGEGRAASTTPVRQRAGREAQGQREEVRPLRSVVGLRGASNLPDALERKQNLEVARQMEKAGKDAKTIWLATGWEKGGDGKWKTEVDDSLSVARNMFAAMKKNANVPMPFEYDRIYYRQTGEGQYDVSLRRKDAKNVTEDFLRYKDVTLYDIGDISPVVEQAIRERKGEDDIAFDDAFNEVTQRTIKEEGKIVNNGVYLPALINHPELFQAYPELENVPVVFDSNMSPYGGTKGSTSDVSEGMPLISLSPYLKDDVVKSTLHHEIQHVIQRIEGFAKGGSPEQFQRTKDQALARINFLNSELSRLAKEMDTPEGKKNPALRAEYDAAMDEKMRIWEEADIDTHPVDKYRRLGGEVEARNVQTRLSMPPEARKSKPLVETEDVERKNQIYLQRAGTQQSRTLPPSSRAGEAGFINIGSLLIGQRQTPILDVITAMRRAGLLTSFKTHLRNITSNTAFQIAEEASRPFQVLADLAMKPGSEPRMVGGLSIAEVARSAKNAVVRGIPQAWQVLLGQRQAHTGLQLSKVQSGLPILDVYVNTVFGAMEAGDRPFKIYAASRALEEMAKLKARAEKRQNPAVDVRQRAAYWRQNPTAGMQARAVEYAEYATFQNDNPVSEAIKKIKEINPYLKFGIEQMAPFDKVPTNIIARIIEYSPAGFLKAGARAVKGRQNAQAQRAAGKVVDGIMTPEDRRAFAQTFGRASFGTMIFALGMMLAAKGLLSGSSDYDSDKEDYFKKRDTVGGEGMLHVPGTDQRISVMGTPAGNVLTLGATVYEQLAKGKDEDEQATGIAKAFGKVATEQPLVRAIKDATDFNSATGYAGSYLGSYVPAIAKDAGEVLDEQPRKVYDKNYNPYQKLSYPAMGRIPPGLPFNRTNLPVNERTNTDERGPLARRLLRAIDPFNTTTERSTSFSRSVRGARPQSRATRRQTR